MKVECWIRCVIGLLILVAGIVIRDEHIGWALILVSIGTFKYVVNLKEAIEMEDSK